MFKRILPSLASSARVNHYRSYSRKAIPLNLPELEIPSAEPQSVQFCESCPPPDFDTPYTHTFPEQHENDIDHKKAMPAAFHLRHLLVSTGNREWPKAIEKDEGTLAHEISEKRQNNFSLRSEMAKAGILVSNTTLPKVAQCCSSSSAYLFPDNLLIRDIPHHQTDKFLEVLLEQDDEVRSIKLRHQFNAVENSDDLWLVCGHTKRDARCGDIGPLILGEMNEVNKDQCTETKAQTKAQTQTGMISHIGGHAFAGNVLLFSGETGQSAWFGRVRPSHIQGLIKEWKAGKIVKSLYRGTFA